MNKNSTDDIVEEVVYRLSLSLDSYFKKHWTKIEKKFEFLESNIKTVIEKCDNLEGYINKMGNIIPSRVNEEGGEAANRIKDRSYVEFNLPSTNFTVSVNKRNDFGTCPSPKVVLNIHNDKIDDLNVSENKTNTQKSELSEELLTSMEGKVNSLYCKVEELENMMSLKENSGKTSQINGKGYDHAVGVNNVNLNVVLSVKGKVSDKLSKFKEVSESLLKRQIKGTVLKTFVEKDDFCMFSVKCCDVRDKLNLLKQKHLLKGSNIFLRPELTHAEVMQKKKIMKILETRNEETKRVRFKQNSIFVGKKIFKWDENLDMLFEACGN